MEKAKRFARDGQRVLFTCFNRALADGARAIIDHELGDLAARVEVDNYHDLVTRFVRKAGIALPDIREMTLEETAHYYNELLPELLSTAVGLIPDRFDAIVVDEAQDFADIWWVTLEELLADPETSSLFVFFDENQRLFTQSGKLPIADEPLSLSENCRTTRAIHAAACRYRLHADAAECTGPAGRAPVEMPVEPGKLHDALRSVLHDLTEVEGVPLDEIVVLTPRSARTSRVLEGTKLGNRRLTWGDAGTNELRCRSISSFKGLEAGVVILAEPERAHAATQNELMYVALTRAKHHVIVLGSLPAPRAVP